MDLASARRRLAGSCITLLLMTGTARGALTPVAEPLPPCQPSGRGSDYLVGPGDGQLHSLEDVPWELLKAGDTVRIGYRSQPYASKLLLKGNGTAEAPIRVCGIPGPAGERPVITGENAVTRRRLVFGSPSSGPIHESRAVVIVKGDERDYRHAPSHIIIDGLSIRGAHPARSFTDSSGSIKAYAQFGACLWVERGSDITIAGNELTDCSQGLFTRSVDDEAARASSITRNILISRNHIHGNGIAGTDRLHNSYVQSVGVVYEFNHFGPLRAGALGNAIKDRSVGPVIRFNRIDEGAHAIDLVEAEDYPVTALADAAYGFAYVYGNQIVKNGETGSVIHFGGDHTGSRPGDKWGEAFFRKGTLFFFHNTVVVTGQGRMFQLSTTEQRAVAWNNIFYFASSPKFPSLRASSEVGSAWTAGGLLSLGRNWINSNWVDSDPWHTVPGTVTGIANLVTGNGAPIDLRSLVPVPRSAVLDSAQPGPKESEGWKVDWQLDPEHRPVPRSIRGTALDLGAVER